MSDNRQSARLLPTTLKILSGRYDPERIKKIKSSRLQKIFNDVVNATSDDCKFSNDDLDLDESSLMPPIWWPHHYNFSQILEYVREETGRLILPFNHVLRRALNHCNNFHKEWIVNVNDKENMTKRKRKITECIDRPIKRPKLNNSSSVLRESKNDIENARISQPKVQVVNIFKTPVVRLTDILKEPAVNKYLFMKMLYLASNDLPDNLSRAHGGKVTTRLSSQMAFSSDIGRRIVKHARYTRSGSNYEGRKNNKLDAYLKNSLVTNEIKQYDISFKPTNCDHLYKFPIRQQRQRINYINDLQAAFCKPVYVRLEKINLSEYLAAGFQCKVALEKTVLPLATDRKYCNNT